MKKSNRKPVERFTVERFVETDTGHRVPKHKSKCKVLHGHRYRFTAKVSGELVQIEGDSSEGMVVDFGEISRILKEKIHDVVDHNTILWENDSLASIIDARDCGGKLLIVQFIPTAENLARWAFHQIKDEIEIIHPSLKLESICVRETPKSWATYPAN